MPGGKEPNIRPKTMLLLQLGGAARECERMFRMVEQGQQKNDGLQASLQVALQKNSAEVEPWAPELGSVSTRILG